MYLCYNIFSNTPTLKTLATTNIETGPKFQKHRCRQTLREDVHDLGGRRHVQDADITDGNAFPNEVEVDLNILRTLMLNGVGGEVDGTDVVTIDESVVWQRSMEHLNELSEPTSFSHVVGHGAILSLGARLGDDVLALGVPGDKVIAEEHSVARQVRGGGGASQVEAEV
jgi:hypothetical protein